MGKWDIVPIGTSVLVEVDRRTGRIGIIQKLGAGIPRNWGLKKGDRVILKANIPNYQEISAINEDDLPASIIDVLDILCIDNKSQFKS